MTAASKTLVVCLYLIAVGFFTTAVFAIAHQKSSGIAVTLGLIIGAHAAISTWHVVQVLAYKP